MCRRDRGMRLISHTRKKKSKKSNNNQKTRVPMGFQSGNGFLKCTCSQSLISATSGRRGRRKRKKKKKRGPTDRGKGACGGSDCFFRACGSATDRRAWRVQTAVQPLCHHLVPSSDALVHFKPPRDLWPIAGRAARGKPDRERGERERQGLGKREREREVRRTGQRFIQTYVKQTDGRTDRPTDGFFGG